KHPTGGECSTLLARSSRQARMFPHRKRSGSGSSCLTYSRVSRLRMTRNAMKRPDIVGFINGNLIAYPSEELRAHVLNAVGIDTAGGVRMTKGRTSKKIDAAIALAMACIDAIESGPKIFNPKAIPTGVGRGIGMELKRQIGSTLGKPSPFRDMDDGAPAKVHEVFRFRWGE